MPYICKAERKRYDKQIKKLVELLIDKFPGENGRNFSEGDLNYVISSIVWKLFDKAPSYRQANKLVGVLECQTRILQAQGCCSRRPQNCLPG